MKQSRNTISDWLDKYRDPKIDKQVEKELEEITTKHKREMKKETLINDNYVPLATIQTSTYVGGYRLGGEYGVKFNFTFKPNWFHRTMMRLCLGWEWIDDKI